MLVELKDLRYALEADEIVPSFQPLVELRTGKLAGFEVLLRWQHPKFGLILPENFISLAEDNGMITQLTEEVLRKAFVACSVVPQPLTLAANISPLQLRDLTLPAQIRAAADRAKFPLQQLTIEITETALVNDLESARSIAYELKSMGCKLALDDFGTGYSSLAHLQSLPFDELKVDRSFVSSMAEKRENRKIVAAVVGLGHSLGLVTVAEGVETAVQADMLLWLGCEVGQGWLFGRPVTIEHLPELLAAVPNHPTPRSLIQGDDWIVSSLEALPAQRLAQLQAIYDGAPVGLCFLDRNLRYVSLNQRYAELNDLPISAHIGKTVKEVIPTVYPRIEPFLLTALSGEPVEDQEISRPAPHPGEEDRHVLLSYEPARDEAKEVIGISIAVMDVTDRKRAEAALHQSESGLRNVFDLNPQVLWVFDRDGNMLEVSSGWVQLTGMTKDQSRKLGWLNALHPDDAGPMLKALRQALHTGKPIDMEYRVKAADGTWKWRRARGAPLCSSAGEVICWYGGSEDIDERKQLEAALRKLHAERTAASSAEDPTS